MKYIDWSVISVVFLQHLSILAVWKVVGIFAVAWLAFCGVHYLWQAMWAKIDAHKEMRKMLTQIMQNRGWRA